MGTPYQSYGTSLAMWDHRCYLPPQVNAPRLTPAMQAGTRFTYPRGMEGWVDLVAPRPGVEPATFRSRVRRGTAAPPRQPNSDHVMYLSALNMRSEWLTGSFYHFLADDTLQSAETDKKTVLWQGKRTHDTVLKFDTYRNLQRHRAVLSAIAQLSCLVLIYSISLCEEDTVSGVLFSLPRAVTCKPDILVLMKLKLNKKLSYRRETARQLRSTSFSARSLIVHFTEHRICCTTIYTRLAKVVSTLSANIPCDICGRWSFQTPLSRSSVFVSLESR